MISGTNSVLAAYGVGTFEYNSPTVGAFQYLGGMYCLVALRAYAAIAAKVRDTKETLEALCYTNAVLFAVALARLHAGVQPARAAIVISGVLGMASYSQKAPRRPDHDHEHACTSDGRQPETSCLRCVPSTTPSKMQNRK